MSTYYNPPADIIAGVKARSEKINEIIQSVVDGFDALPPDFDAITAGSGLLISDDDTTVGYAEDKLLAGDAITLTTGNPGGNETMTIAVEDAAITETKIADLAITEAKLQDDSVSTAKLQDESVTWFQIKADAVTYSRIQNVAASDRLLGRASAGSGIIEEIPLTAAGRALIDDVDAAAQRVTLSAAKLGVNADITSLTGLDDDGIPRAKVADIRDGKNIIINGGFSINQRVYVSSATLAATFYAHDRWKAGASGGDYSFTQMVFPTEITIATGKSLIQVIEDKNVVGGTYTLSWEGTAQGRYAVNSDTPAGSYASSPITIFSQNPGTTMSVEFDAGTLSKPKLELGTIVTDFELPLAASELIECQRYYEKTYNPNSTPGSNVPQGVEKFTSRKADQLDTISKRFKVNKATDPVIVIYNWYTGATGQARDDVGGSALTISVGNINQSGFAFNPTINTIADHHYGYHYTAEAEL